MFLGSTGRGCLPVDKILKNNVLELNLLINLWLRWRVAETAGWKTSSQRAAGWEGKRVKGKEKLSGIIRQGIKIHP